MNWRAFKINKISFKELKQNTGFVLLFAVTLTSIILAITLSVTDIALRELGFSTSAQNTNNAFLAADTGIECATFYDKPIPGPNRFIFPNPGGSMTCSGATVTPTFSGNASIWNYDFIITTLGGVNTGCVKVNVRKDTVIIAPYTRTTITSKGYNIGDALCNSTSPIRVEREIIVTY